MTQTIYAKLLIHIIVKVLWDIIKGSKTEICLGSYAYQRWAN